MKLTILWALSGAWLAILVYVAWTYFREGFVSDMGFLDRPKPIFTGIGALTVGAVPLFLTYLVHRFNKKRMRGRLQKEKERIERQLRRLDEQEGVRPASAPAPAPAKSTEPGTSTEPAPAAES